MEPLNWLEFKYLENMLNYFYEEKCISYKDTSPVTWQSSLGIDPDNWFSAKVLNQ